MKNIKIIFAALSLVIAVAFSVSAQSVSFTSLGGEKIDLASQKGKVVVLAIGASWLPLSKDQAVAINKLSRKYNADEVAIYFIATDSASNKSKNYASNEQIQKFVDTNKISITVLRDSDGVESIKKYKLDQLPAFLILNKEGALVDGPFTGIDPKTDISVLLSQKIDKLL